MTPSTYRVYEHGQGRCRIVGKYDTREDAAREAERLNGQERELNPGSGWYWTTEADGRMNMTYTIQAFGAPYAAELIGEAETLDAARAIAEANLVQMGQYCDVLNDCEIVTRYRHDGSQVVEIEV